MIYKDRIKIFLEPMFSKTLVLGYKNKDLGLTQRTSELKHTPNLGVFFGDSGFCVSKQSEISVFP